MLCCCFICVFLVLCFIQRWGPTRNRPVHQIRLDFPSRMALVMAEISVLGPIRARIDILLVFFIFWSQRICCFATRESAVLEPENLLSWGATLGATAPMANGRAYLV